MSAEMAVRVGVLAALRGDAALAAMLNGVWDGAPVKASAPFAVVGECLGAEWGTKDRAGREVRVALTVQDRREGGEALAELLALADAAVKRVVLAGYGVAGVALLRTRILRGREDGWRALVDYRVRVLVEG
ncbi:MAG: tail completion protein gp17 [Sphingobium sp.]